MFVPWGAVGPTMPVGACKLPHAPERSMGRHPLDPLSHQTDEQVAFPAPLNLPSRVPFCSLRWARS
eukprot:scaffold15663_cov109-Isochrysis_galbana.AAC.2